MLSQAQLKIVHGIAVVLYACFFVVACWAAYYAYMASTGASGTTITDMLEAALRKKESSSFGTFGELLAAVPAITLGMAATKEGAVTAYGKLYMCFLLPTFFVTFIVGIFFNPSAVDLGAQGTPQLVAATAGQLSNFALTYIMAVFGLSKFMPAAEKAK